MKDKLRELAERWRYDDGQETLYVMGRRDGYHTCARELLALLDAEGDGGAVGVDMFDTASKVRDYLNHELPDENKHIFGEVLAALTYAQAHPARSGVVSDEDVEAACIASHIQYNDGTTEWDGYTDKEKGYAMNRMRRALEHFAKGERHER